MKYILDACALLTILNRETGWKKVDTLITRADAGDILLFMHTVNLLEVYYGIHREKEQEASEELLDYIDASSIQIIDDISVPFFRQAGRLKATYNISLADAIGLATASDLSGTFVTSDGEIKPVETAENVSIFWFRQPKQK